MLILDGYLYLDNLCARIFLGSLLLGRGFVKGLDGPRAWALGILDAFLKPNKHHGRLETNSHRTGERR